MSQPRVRPLQHPYTGTIAASIWAYSVGHGQINFIAKIRILRGLQLRRALYKTRRHVCASLQTGWGGILDKHVGTRISDSTDQWCP